MMLLEVLSFDSTADEGIIPNRPQHESRIYHSEEELHNNGEGELKLINWHT